MDQTICIDKEYGELESSHLRTYFEAISSGFCPFMRPAQAKGVLKFSEFHLSGPQEEIERKVLCMAVLLTERFRKVRSTETETPAKLLSCQNPIFYFPEESLSGKEIFAWPHWLLKLLYLEASIMFGKFWVGEEDVAANGKPIPVPPANFLSIRSAVHKKDVRFFKGQLEFLPVLDSSFDAGQCCLEKAVEDKSLLRMVRSEVQEVCSVLDEELLKEQIIRSTIALANSKLFESVIAWAERTHPVNAKRAVA